MKKNFFAKPMSSYYLLLGSTGALSALGLVMVLSASSIHSLGVNGSSYAIVWRQFLFLLIAVPLGWVASQIPLASWRSMSRRALMGSIFILALVQIPGVSENVNGNRNWIALGPITIQPSEFAKFFMILWAGYMLSKVEVKNKTQTNVIYLLLPGFIAVMILIMMGRDLGTAVVYAAILIGLLFVSGIPMSWIGVSAVSTLGLISLLIALVPNRAQRFLAVLQPFAPEYYKLAGWQPAHSIMGFATGGLFGVGLGASRQKWGNLPEAHTDFIFAVIGEELGLLGTLCVLALFAALIFSIFRIALGSKDPMTRNICAGIGCWIGVQTVMNIGSATSVLPVVGVTLPLLSYGGSSLVATYIALGFVLGAVSRDLGIKVLGRGVKK